MFKRSVEHPDGMYGWYACCVLATDHSTFDSGEMNAQSRLLIDTSNTVTPSDLKGDFNNIIKLGVARRPVGR